MHSLCRIFESLYSKFLSFTITTFPKRFILKRNIDIFIPFNFKTRRRLLLVVISKYKETVVEVV